MSNKKIPDHENLIGKNLSVLRKKLKLKQYQLAKKLSTSPGYISEIESGKTIPGGNFFLSLKRELGADIDELFCNHENRSEDEILHESKTNYLSLKKGSINSQISENSDLIRYVEKQIADLRTDKDDLRAQISELKEDKKRLLEENEKLKRELSSLAKSKNSA